jgi:hypothetical protein
MTDIGRESGFGLDAARFAIEQRMMEKEERFRCVAPYEQKQHQPNNTFPQWQF